MTACVHAWVDVCMRSVTPVPPLCALAGGWALVGGWVGVHPLPLACATVPGLSWLLRGAWSRGCWVTASWQWSWGRVGVGEEGGR